jgi:hypothetical protein
MSVDSDLRRLNEWWQQPGMAMVKTQIEVQVPNYKYTLVSLKYSLVGGNTRTQWE